MFVFLLGLHIIFTLDEVAFIQNLVFYIEAAYKVAVSINPSIFSHMSQLSRRMAQDVSSAKVTKVDLKKLEKSLWRG